MSEHVGRSERTEMEVHGEQRWDGNFDERTRKGATSEYEHNQEWYVHLVTDTGGHDGTEMVPQKSLMMFPAVRCIYLCQPIVIISKNAYQRSKAGKRSHISSVFIRITS